LPGLQLLDIPQADVRPLGELLLRQLGRHPKSIQILPQDAQDFYFHALTIQIFWKGVCVLLVRNYLSIGRATIVLRQTMRVLVLDNHAALARMLSAALADRGISVLHFSLPHEALENLEEGDMLITDSQMPEMTGLEVARKAYAQGWRGPFLLMSGRAASLDQQNLPSFLTSIIMSRISPESLGGQSEEPE
jgi:CheY-like chemotaxis protein